LKEIEILKHNLSECEKNLFKKTEELKNSTKKLETQEVEIEN